MNVSTWCPLVDAFHYRDLDAISFILSRSRDQDIRDCIEAKNIFGSNLLHVATNNKVSGLARLMVLILRKRIEDKENTKMLLNSLGLDWRNDDDDDTIKSSYVRASSVVSYMNEEKNVKELLLELRRLFGSRSMSTFTDELDGHGFSAFHIACRDGRVDVMEMLRHIGSANINRTDLFGRTCLDLIRLMSDAMGDTTRRKVLKYLNVTSLNIGDSSSNVGYDTTCSNNYNHDNNNNTGGWRPPSETTMTWLRNILDTASHIDVISASNLNRTTFLRDFVSLRRPVLLKNVNIGESSTWTRESMLGHLGDEIVMASIKPYESIHGGNSRDSAPTTLRKHILKKQQHDELAEVLNNTETLLPRYVFEPSFVARNKNVLSSSSTQHTMLNLESPPRLFDFPVILRQFYIGTAFTGSHFHFHNNPAVNVLVYGVKLWLLVPPFEAFYSALHPIEEMRDMVLSRNISSFCPHCRVVVQHSSQVVFVPDQWGHLVLNLADCVGLATEFSPVL